MNNKFDPRFIKFDKKSKYYSEDLTRNYQRVRETESFVNMRLRDKGVVTYGELRKALGFERDSLAYNPTWDLFGWRLSEGDEEVSFYLIEHDGELFIDTSSCHLIVYP